MAVFYQFVFYYARNNACILHNIHISLFSVYIKMLVANRALNGQDICPANRSRSMYTYTFYSVLFRF